MAIAYEEATPHTAADMEDYGATGCSTAPTPSRSSTIAQAQDIAMPARYPTYKKMITGGSATPTSAQSPRRLPAIAAWAGDRDYCLVDHWDVSEPGSPLHPIDEHRHVDACAAAPAAMRLNFNISVADDEHSSSMSGTSSHMTHRRHQSFRQNTDVSAGQGKTVVMDCSGTRSYDYPFADAFEREFECSLDLLGFSDFSALAPNGEFICDLSSSPRPPADSSRPSCASPIPARPINVAAQLHGQREAGGSSTWPWHKIAAWWQRMKGEESHRSSTETMPSMNIWEPIGNSMMYM